MADTDPRGCCYFCFHNRSELVPATKLAPQHDGGDVDRPAVWYPVCDDHFSDWFDEIEPEDRLPAWILDDIRLMGVA